MRGIKHSRIASHSILSECRSTPGFLSFSSSSSFSFTPRDRSTPSRPAGAKRNPFPHRASALTFLHLFLVRARPATTTWAHICIRHRVRKDVSCTWIYGENIEEECSSRGKDECTGARKGKCALVCEICVTIISSRVLTEEQCYYRSTNRIYNWREKADLYSGKIEKYIETVNSILRKYAVRKV